MAYSTVNHRVMRFWSGLLYDNLAWTHPTSGPNLRRGDRGPPQLKRIGFVLSIVDGDQLTPCQRKTEVEGLGLGPRLGRRDQNQGELRPRILVAERVDGLVVIGLHENEHLEAVHRILQTGRCSPRGD